jgi:mandelate racemase
MSPALAEPFKVQNSEIVIPEKPGCGIEWDEAAITRLRFEA